jgi:membrane fusion protein (multidrug efflux system)
LSPLHACRNSLLAIAIAATVAGCGKEAPKGPPQRPPVDVTAVTVTAKDTPVSFEFVGQTQSSREVEIRARVEGFLDKRLYTEGDLVRAGQPLFQIDTKPFNATLQSAKGQVAQQQAALDTAVANLNRIRPLAEQNAVSKKDLDDAIGAEQRARAAVFAAQGQLQTAQLNLGYATVFSPLTGLSSFAKLQEGSYLSPSNNLLTSVSQLDPIWVNFSISENETNRYRDEVARNLLRLPGDSRFEVEVVLADGTIFPNRGEISFAEASFSKETGTFLVRAVLVNPKGQLRPGQFVRVRVLGSVRPNSILVPQRAVQQGAKSHFVWVVDKDGKAEQRPVEVGPWNGDDWFITEGLRTGEQVVVDGAIRVSPGATLKITPYTPPPVEAKAPAKAAEPLAFELEQATGKGTSGPAARPSPAPSKSSPSPSGANRTSPAKVYFATDSDVLTPEGAGVLGPLARWLANEPSATVHITGYADKTGATTRNVQLALDRAKAVRAALIAHGVRPEQTVLKAPAAVTGGEDHREARRVEVVHVASGAAAKNATPAAPR